MTEQHAPFGPVAVDLSYASDLGGSKTEVAIRAIAPAPDL
jgi:hypothetical protein